MMNGQKLAASIASLAAALALASAAMAQTGSDTSCAERSDQQLRRFNEQCIGQVLAFTETMPKGSATIASEKDKYYVKISRAGGGLQAESVSRQNFPYLKPETEQALKSLGWTPPDVEFGGFKREFGDQDVKSGGAAQEIAKALQAFGMMPGEAISITVAGGEQ
jgi:hypothetical protein